MGKEIKNLKELMDIIEISRETAVLVDFGGFAIDTYEMNTDPYTFLMQAENDYYQGQSSAALNSISNARRSIFCQVDQALLTFGIEPDRDYRKNIEKLQRLGLSMPRILRKVSKYRNLLEHEYRIPTKDQIEDALDLASLFLNSINPVLKNIYNEFQLANRDEQVDDFDFRRNLLFDFRNDKCKNVHCHVRAVEVVDPPPIGSEKTRRILGELNIYPEHDDFYIIVQLLVDLFKKTDEALLLDKFFKHFSQ